MRRVVVSAVALCLAASASALTPSTSNVFQPVQKPWNEISRQEGVRVTGDTVADPFIIGALPFTTTGSTCSFINDYDYACPYTGSTSADVVYRFVPTQYTILTIDLCASSYDTKVYVFANTVGNVIACNDDWCAYQSMVSNVTMPVGNTYYIVVDGYGGSCGSFALALSDYSVCVIDCPPGAMLEGEATCYDGYSDTYNGGCNVTPMPVFQVLDPTGGDITICGTTGIYLFGTSLYRDTDWYQLDITETANICLSGDAEIPMTFCIIDGRGGCPAATVAAYADGEQEICWPVSEFCHNCEAGTWWVWTGPSAWDTSFACGSAYVMTVSGYGGGTPAASTTWGKAKGLFR